MHESSTSTSSNTSSAVSDACQPSLSSAFETEKPFVFVSTTKVEKPEYPALGSVLVSTRMKSARAPLVMNVLAPLITHRSPLRLATVLMLARSLPAPGSVKAYAPIASPRTARGSQRAFASAVPYFSSAWLMTSECIFTATVKPTEGSSPNASHHAPASL